MGANYKFHAIAIAAICVVVTLLYALIGPSSNPAPAQTDMTGGRAIEIVSATWGEGCNPYILEAREKQQSTPIEKDAAGVIIPRPRLELVTPNNVIERVRQICGGKIQCNITPTNANLGVEILASCAKKLELTYRCYSYDRLWNLSLGQGQTKTIDCHAAPEPAGK